MVKPEEGFSATTQLTPREQLIRRVLEMTDFEVTTTLSLVEHLEDIEDSAIIAARKGEVGIPFEDVIKEFDFTQERLNEIARAEGWM